MTLEIPSIHDTDFEQIVAEAKARIPVHNPEWTNFNDSDPGITLLQLFAFMTDNLLYRANRIPERSRQKFLHLLDIAMEPATAAGGIVTFTNKKGPLSAVVTPAGTEVLAGKVSFRTHSATEVLPVEAAVFYKADVSTVLTPDEQARYRALYTDLAPDNAEATLYETRRLEPPAAGAVYPKVELATDTIDGSLWLALLARDADSLDATRSALGGAQLSIGIMPGVSAATRVLFPKSTRRSTDDPGFEFWLPVGGSLPDPPASREPSFTRLAAEEDGDIVVEPGLVRIDLPAADRLVLWDNLEPAAEGVGSFPPLIDDAERARLVTWIQIKRRTGQLAESSLLSASISWVGVNATRVSQRSQVRSERLGLGTGLSDQTLRLANTPVIADSVTLTVGSERWVPTDDLLAAGSELDQRNQAGEVQPSRVFVVDRVSGEIRFGDGLHGARPAAGLEIRASYDYGGGKAGTVPAGAISKGPALPAGISVANQIPTWGGSEAESTEEAERRMAQVVRHRHRLVSADDFEQITFETPGVDIARVEVLPLVHPDTPSVESAGVVTVLAIPRFDPVQPAAPRPDRMFLDAICRFLDERRLVTTELHVRGPVYVPVAVSIGIEVEPGRDLPPVRQAVQDAVRAFCSPLPSADHQGWPLRKAVDRLELWTVAAKVEGVGKVVDVLLGDESTTATRDRIDIAHLQLPHLTALGVQSGDPAPLGALRGQVLPTSGTILPIPTVPEEC